MTELSTNSHSELLYRLSRHLIDAGKLTEAEAKRTAALPEALSSGLGTILSNTGLISDTDLANAYASILELPLLNVVETEATEPLAEIVENLSETYLRAAYILPLDLVADTLIVATANPEDSFALETLKLATNKKIETKIATRHQIQEGLDKLFGKNQSVMSEITDRLDSHLEIESEQEAIDRLRDQAGEAPVIKLVNLIIQKAVDAQSSDIHIEAFENQLKLRYRIDGILRAVESPPAHSISAIISRIKLMAKMNIAERRLPQDGGFRYRLQGRLIDIRVSTTPTLHGESLVLRILDKNNTILSLKELGFTEHYNEKIHEILKSPHGIILVTGPTGSGKTTTLYAALNHLNTDARKIMTVEDPVEYQLSGINQIQAKPDIGLDFARALRSIVRQDPDIIMIGEMRDLETARTAVQSALTGHLVLSTLHTNDAVSSLIRLQDMGIESYLVTSSVVAIIAQRLVRKLCPLCKTAYQPTQELLTKLNLNRSLYDDELVFYKSAGCDSCNDHGYKGRSVISEILVLTESIKEKIVNGTNEIELKKIAQDDGMISIAHDGLSKVAAGITSVEEVFRVAYL